MRAFADKRNWLQGTATFNPARIAVAASRSNLQRPPTLLSRRTGGNQTQQQLSENSISIAPSEPSEVSHLSHDFGRIPVYHRDEAAVGVSDKDPEGEKGTKSKGAPTPAPKPTPAPSPSPAPAAPAKTKKAGVESFEVNWEKGASADPSKAKFKLLFSAKFKKDETYDPALADFRQNVYHKLKITAGTHKGEEADNSPLHDDGYSRKDDIGNNTMDDIYFVGTDAPGPNDLAEDDVIDFRFTAEQMIIDLSDRNKVIAKRGPYTAKITGPHPRKHHGVPKLLTK